MKIKIVADSSSDMHHVEDELFELVPLKIMNDQNEYIDNKQLNVKAMAEELKSYKGKTTTSCPNTTDWIKSFDGADVVYAGTPDMSLRVKAKVSLDEMEECISKGSCCLLYCLAYFRWTCCIRQHGCY